MKKLAISLLFLSSNALGTPYSLDLGNPDVQNVSFDLDDSSPAGEDYGGWAGWQAVTNLAVRYANTNLTRDFWEWEIHQGYQGISNAPVNLGDDFHGEFNLYLEGQNEGTGIENARNLDQKLFSLKSWSLELYHRIGEGTYELLSYGGEVVTAWVSGPGEEQPKLAYGNCMNDEGCH